MSAELTPPPGAAAQSPPAAARGRALRHIDPHIWDGVLAFVFTAAGLIYVLFMPNLSPPFRSFDAVSVVLLLAVTLPLFALRTYPLPVFGIIGAAAIVGAIINDAAINVGYLAAAIALFSVAARSSVLAQHDRRDVGVGDAHRHLWRPASREAPPRSGWASARGCLFSIVWLAGVAIRAYRENVRETREAWERARADRERAELYLHDLEMHAQEAVGLERSRLARELHDVVGHALNVVVLQAGAAQRVFDKKPDVGARVARVDRGRRPPGAGRHRTHARHPARRRRRPRGARPAAGPGVTCRADRPGA